MFSYHSVTYCRSAALTEHSLYLLCLTAMGTEESFAAFLCDIVLQRRFCVKVFAPADERNEAVQMSKVPWSRRSSSAVRMQMLMASLVDLKMSALWESRHNPWLYALFLIVMISVRQSVTLWSDEDRAELVFELQTFEGKYTKGHFNVKVMIIFSQP